MSITSYLPQSLRRLEVFQKVGKLGVDRVIVGDGHIALILHEGRCVTVFDHSTSDEAKQRASHDDRMRSEVLARGSSRSNRRGPHDVLIVSDNNMPVTDCIFHRKEPHSPLNLVVIWHNGAVRMWDYRCGKWSPASSMKLATTGHIISACLCSSAESGDSLVYIEHTSSGCTVRIAPLSQDTRLSSTLIDSTASKAATGQMMLTVPHQTPPSAVFAAPLGGAWVVCPENQVLLLPIPPAGPAASQPVAPPCFSLNLRCRDSPVAGAPPPGPCLEYTSYALNHHTLELLLFDAVTAKITIVGAGATQGGTVYPVVASTGGFPLSRGPLQIAAVSPSHVVLLGEGHVAVCDLLSEAWGQTPAPANLTGAAQVTQGYSGPALLYSPGGIYQIRPEAVVTPPPAPAATASDAADAAVAASTQQTARQPIDWDADISLDALEGMVPETLPPAPPPGISQRPDSCVAVQNWLAADRPVDALEATEALGEHLNPIARPLGKREFGVRRVVRRSAAHAAPKGKRKVRVIIPVKGGVGDDTRASDDDVSWGERLRLYNRLATNEGLWDAVIASEAANEEMQGCLAQKAVVVPPKCADTEMALFSHLLAAGSTGEEEYWEPPPAPTTSSDATDTAAALLDELGFYSLAELSQPLSTASLLRPSPDALPPLDAAESAPPAFTSGVLPLPLVESLPYVFEGMPHVVPLMALHIASFCAGGAPPGDAFCAELRGVAQQLLPYLRPCSCPTQSEALIRSRGRAVSLLTLWSGDTAAAILNALEESDFLFALAALRVLDITPDVGQAVLGSLLRNHDGIRPFAGAAHDADDATALLEELQPVTAEDIIQLRTLLWQRLRHIEGGGVHLLSLLNASGERCEGEGAVDAYALLKETLKDFTFGKACAGDVNDATAQSIDRLADSEAGEALLQIAVESPFLWDVDNLRFTPDLDATKGHLLYSLLVSHVENSSSRSLSISETHTSTMSACPAEQHTDTAPIVPICPLPSDLHPLSVPLSALLPLLGVECASG